MIGEKLEEYSMLNLLILFGLRKSKKTKKINQKQNDVYEDHGNDDVKRITETIQYVLTKH